MKLRKVLFVNFAALANAMKCKQVEIDFTKAKNRICLLVGPNGCGKTSILSLLHPFSGLGNLDVRDGNGLILANKDGYKEVIIDTEENEYLIKHYYTHHKDKAHSVKSYIQKNGVELNENGNVTSFKEYVKVELGIEPDYLKLIRLGDNVTSLTKLGETDRKNFMSKLLDDIGIYVTLYKKVNDDLVQLKHMISHAVDKQNRLGVLDMTILKEQINSDVELLTKEQEHFGEISGQLSIYNHEIAMIPDKDTLYDRLVDTNRKLRKMQKVLDRKDTLKSEKPEYYAKRIIEADKTIASNITFIQTNKILIQTYLDQLDESEAQLRTYLVQYQKEEASDRELRNMNERLDTLQEELTERGVEFTDPPLIQKAELEKFVGFLNEVKKLLDTTYGYGKETVKAVVKLMKDKRNVISYINTHLLDMEPDSESDSALFLHALEKRFHFTDAEPNVTCDNTECEARKLWVQVYNLMNTYSEEKKEKKSAEFYKNMESVYANLQSFFPNLSIYDSLILHLPENLRKCFVPKTIFKNIADCKNLVEEKDLNEYVSYVTEYDNYLKKQQEAEGLKESIQRYQGLSNLKYINEQIVTLQQKIAKLREDIKEKKQQISDMEEATQQLRYEMEADQDIKEALEEYDEVKKKSDILTSEYETLKENQEKQRETELQVQQSRMVINNLTEKVQREKVVLSQYKELQKELKAFNKIYDDMIYTKDSLSSKKGVMLYYTKRYLRDVVEVTNELLDIAYDGRIIIDKFDITPTSFRIPFYNDDVLLADIKYASQGELSFLNTALSFALVSQAIKDYNILLLDEVDGGLDQNNREKFIQILENQIERVGSEQTFLITHNNMFSAYPVDILNLDFDHQLSDQEYNFANYIPITRS